MEKIKKEVKEYAEFVENEIDEEDNEFDCDEIDFNIKNQYEDTSNYIENNFNNYSNFKVYFYFEINKDYNFVFPIESDIFNIEKQYIYDLLRNIVKIVNNKNITINYKGINYIISLKDCEDKNKDFYIKNYELKHCKKVKYTPKDYLPSYSSNSILKNIIKERISFVSKDPLNIMLIQKYDDFKEKNLNEKIKYNKESIKNININETFNVNEKNINKYKNDLCKSKCFIF